MKRNDKVISCSHRDNDVLTLFSSRDKLYEFWGSKFGESSHEKIDAALTDCGYSINYVVLDIDPTDETV